MSKLEVNNLQVSFWTAAGSVRAVRNISFKLQEGETLAIVGESGSGKSVTAKTIMGILAPNATVDSGEIMYNGMDLLTLSEEDYHLIRGNNIAMIFQDPLSSLDPIVRVGQQLTESIIATNQTRSRVSQRDYDRLLEAIRQAMFIACEDELGDYNAATKKTESLLKILESLLDLTGRNCGFYQQALEFTEALASKLKEIRVDAIGGTYHSLSDDMVDLKAIVPHCYNRWLVVETERMDSLVDQMCAKVKQLKNMAELSAENKRTRQDIQDIEAQMTELVEEALAKDEPDFFALAYAYLYNLPLEQAGESIAEMNQRLSKALDTAFLNDFYRILARACHLVSKEKNANKDQLAKDIQSVIERLPEDFTYEQIKAETEKLEPLARAANNPLSPEKETAILVFPSAIAGHLRDLKVYKKISRYTGKKRSKAFRKNKISQSTSFEIMRDNILQLFKRTQEALVRYSDKSKALDDVEQAKAVMRSLIDLARQKDYHITKAAAKERAIHIMDEVGIPEPRRRFMQYPFEFSGGMRQRIVIAIALSSNPDILICDEPTTALDVTIQAQILELIKKLKDKHKLSVIFITHDLGVVANVADYIAVMYAGKVIEKGTSEEIFYRPLHPYTWALLASMPDLETEEKLESIPGTPPDMIHPPKGDAFALRNPYALGIDFETMPPMFKVSETGYVASWLVHPKAPKVMPPPIVTERIERMTGQPYGEVDLIPPEVDQKKASDQDETEKTSAKQVPDKQ